MTHPAIAALAHAVEQTHGGKATHLRTDWVHETVSTGETVWKGDVEVFELANHPKATMAFAWSEPREGQKPLVYAVLQIAPVTSAAAAVRASILADAQPGRRHN